MKGRSIVAAFAVAAFFGSGATAYATSTTPASNRTIASDPHQDILELIASDPTLNRPDTATQAADGRVHMQQAAPHATSGYGVMASSLASLTRGPGYILKGGRNHRVSSRTLAGAYVLGGRMFICIDYNAMAPNGPRVKGSINTLMGQMRNQTAARRAWTIWNEFGDDLQRTRSRRLGAALWFSLNHLTNDRGFMRDAGGYKSQLRKLDRGVLPMVDDLLEFSQSYGPIKTKSLTATATAMGENGSAMLTLKTKTGKAASGRLVSFKVAGGVVTAKSAKTNSAGQARVNFRRTTTGKVVITASYTSPSSEGGTANRPTRGHQIGVVAGSAYESGKVSASSKFEAPSLGARANCGTDCDGAAPTTVVATNQRGAATMKAVYKVGRKVVASLLVPGGKTMSKTITLADAQQAQRAYCYVNKRGVCITKMITYGKPYTIVCPPWPEVTITIKCACKGPKNVTVNVELPKAKVTGRFYELVATKNGRVFWTSERTQASTAKSISLSVPRTTAVKGDDIVVIAKIFANASSKKVLRTGEIGSN